MIDPLIGKRQQLLLATQLCRMVLKVCQNIGTKLAWEFEADLKYSGQPSHCCRKRRKRVLERSSLFEPFVTSYMHDGVWNREKMSSRHGVMYPRYPKRQLSSIVNQGEHVTSIVSNNQASCTEIAIPLGWGNAN